MGQFRWTASKLLTYLRCPYAYFLKYKKKIRVPVPWYFVFGRSIHKAIRVCHEGNPHQYFKATPKRPLFFKNPGAFGRFWCDLWPREVEAAEKGMGIRWKEREDEDKQKKKLKGLGRAMLAGTKDSRWRGYYQAILQPPFPIKILKVEFTIKTKFWGFPFTGKIDQIWETPQGIAITDLTTGKSANIKFLQMSLYDLSLKQICQTDPEAREHFGSGAQRYYIWNLRNQEVVPTAPQNPQKVREALEYAMKGIQVGEFPQTFQDDICRSCEFQKICGKTAGKPIPVSSVNNGVKLEISIPVRPKLKKPKQLHFKGFRGNQVKGKKRK